MQPAPTEQQSVRHSSLLPTPVFFYQYLGAHSLLIGLLPFFLAVFLWQHGVNLANLCFMMGASGLSFVGMLPVWQRLYRYNALRFLIWLTFLLELTLILTLGFYTLIPGEALHQIQGESYAKPMELALACIVIGLANGAYNAFFWTTQRYLFLQLLGKNDTGRRFGNFQIFVTVFLKVGILLGGFLLDLGGFIWLLALSAGISFTSAWYLNSRYYSIKPAGNPNINLLKALKHSDKNGSKPIFAIDGVFLYLESHFWVLSLFLVVNQDFSSLGITVVALALSFTLLFFLIKNRIDALPTKQTYRYAVWMYAISWLLRFTLDAEVIGSTVLITLVFITFFSTFFRLAFNKQFFNNARNDEPVKYLLFKSYSSQFYLGAVFLLLGIILTAVPIADVVVIQGLYAVVACVSLTYLLYSESPNAS